MLGAGGQLGQTLLEAGLAQGAGQVAMLGMTRAELDICDADAVVAAFKYIKPRLIVNAAAYTAVDRAETEEAAAIAGNVTGPETIAKQANALQIPILHVSTDYVFDGEKHTPYLETDPIHPTSVYGRSKAMGEEAVRRAASRHIILRTAWVYSEYGNNFLKTMLRLAATRDEVSVVADQTGNPTATVDIAQAILAVDRALQLDASATDLYGTYHFAGFGITSWHGFAEAIFKKSQTLTGNRPLLRAISSAEYPTPVKRPANSALDSTKFVNRFGYRAKPWQDRVDKIVQRILQA